jgi:hypothetical protein
LHCVPQASQNASHELQFSHRGRGNVSVSYYDSNLAEEGVCTGEMSSFFAILLSPAVNSANIAKGQVAKKRMFRVLTPWNGFAFACACEGRHGIE